jgi:hypothetical protein
VLLEYLSDSGSFKVVQTYSSASAISSPITASAGEVFALVEARTTGGWGRRSICRWWWWIRRWRRREQGWWVRWSGGHGGRRGQQAAIKQQQCSDVSWQLRCGMHQCQVTVIIPSWSSEWWA